MQKERGVNAEEGERRKCRRREAQMQKKQRGVNAGEGERRVEKFK